jgi:DNA replication licensing factor MCM5
MYHMQAMEQQTISIAKAGITTMLKARTSVLAAANPPSGRYDDLAALEDNIELQTTILSRFDLIFIVKDQRIRERDAMIANHVLSIHRQGGQQPGGALQQQPPFLTHSAQLSFLSSSNIP